MVRWLLLTLLAAGPALAMPIDRTLYIQPIDVCDDGGANCVDGDAIIGRNKSLTSAIFAQAGIGIVYLPTERFADSSYLTTSFATNAATDEARRLLRLPGHMQNDNEQVLNMFFVDQLIDPLGQQTLYGGSFTNGNGMIIAANARADTIAHEIGHNTGLDHLSFGAGGVANLMTDGGIRSIGETAAGVLAGSYDQLTALQIEQLRNPLFSVGQLAFRAYADPVTFFPHGYIGDFETGVAVASPAAYPGLHGYRANELLGVKLGNIVAPRAGLPAGKLKGVRLRFLPGSDVTVPQSGELTDNDAAVDAGLISCGPVECTILPGAPRSVGGTRTILGDGTIEFAWNFSATAADQLSGFDTFETRLYAPSGPPIPFSVQFVYDGGLVSQAFYDASTGSFTTEAPSDSFVLPGSNPVQDPAFVAPIPTGFGVEVVASVPEPASLALLAGLALLPPALRRRG